MQNAFEKIVAFIASVMSAAFELPDLALSKFHISQALLQVPHFTLLDTIYNIIFYLFVGFLGAGGAFLFKKLITVFKKKQKPEK